MAPQSVVSPKMTTPALPMTYDDGKFKKVIQVEKKEKTERRNGRDEGRRKSNQETEGRNAGKDSGRSPDRGGTGRGSRLAETPPGNIGGNEKGRGTEAEED